MGIGLGLVLEVGLGLVFSVHLGLGLDLGVVLGLGFGLGLGPVPDLIRRSVRQSMDPSPFYRVTS